MKKTFPFLIALLIFIGGYGFEKVAVEVFGFIFSLGLFIYLFSKKQKIRVPKSFLAYTVFLLFVALSFLWSVDGANTLEYFLLFLTGGVVWIVFYNLDKKYVNKLDVVLFVVGVLFFALYTYYLYGDLSSKQWSLVFPATTNHHHLGDYWAVILPLFLFGIDKKRSFLKYFALFIGLIAIAISLSRSAHVALVGAVVFFFLKGKRLANRRIIYTLFGIFIILFLATGFFKPTLLSRPYFVQSLSGLLKHPFGVGMGNFGDISQEVSGVFGMDGYSSIAHSVVFEVVSGVGVFGLLFVYWLTRKVLDVWKNPDMLFAPSFVALTVNFLFDTTYFIPGMLYLWFMLLGLSEER